MIITKKCYKNLDVWKKSIDLVQLIYAYTENFPNKEVFGITNQMKRSAVSIPSNIAEGQAKRYKKEFIRYLYQSLGSLAELETQAIIAGRIKYISDEKQKYVILKIDEIQKMIYGLIKKIDRNEQLLATRYSQLDTDKSYLLKV